MKTVNEVKKAAMIQALEKSMGIVTTACKMVGIVRDTHYTWYNNDAEYKKEVDSISDLALDFAESKLHQQIQEGDTTAIIFYLKCRGKKRGYIERYELNAKIEELKTPSWFVNQDHIMTINGAQSES